MHGWRSFHPRGIQSVTTNACGYGSLAVCVCMFVCIHFHFKWLPSLIATCPFYPWHSTWLCLTCFHDNMADMSVHGRPVYGARECSRHMDSCRPAAFSPFSQWDFSKINPRVGIHSLSSSQGNGLTIAYPLNLILYLFIFVSLLAAVGAPLSAWCARDKEATGRRSPV